MVCWFLFLEIGYHTDSNGHFTPKGKCLLGLRYNVVKILDAKGQSAVLVEAEVIFSLSFKFDLKWTDQQCLCLYQTL